MREYPIRKTSATYITNRDIIVEAAQNKPCNSANPSHYFHAYHTYLVKDHVRHPLQLRVGLQPPEQDSRRDKEKLRVLAGAPLEPDLVPHSPAHSLAALCRHALGHACGANPPKKHRFQRVSE